MEKVTLLGAICGDVVGSIYEFHSTKDYHFPLMECSQSMSYTDDTIMTIAVADWIMSGGDLSQVMQKWCRKYPHPMGGYGGRFSEWIASDNPQPYNSWGNGSAMRVSPCGFAYDSLEETLEAARLSALVTHNHPEGIKGAEATAAAIYLSRTGKSKQEIRDYITSTFGYDLSRSCQEIRPSYRFNESCQETVPESLTAFLESRDYEDAIRLAVSMGGDADTMGAITGAVAAAYYGSMPEELCEMASGKLPEDMMTIVKAFDQRYL